MMKNYIGAAILILVALLAKFSPLLHVNLGLDVYLHDEYFVIPLADVIFRLCLAAATAWLLSAVLCNKWSRLR